MIHRTEPDMTTSTTLAIVFLGLLSLLQLTRVLLGWSVIVNGVSIPIWASAVACLISGALALMLLRGSRH
jgi:hypothetical protein